MALQAAQASALVRAAWQGRRNGGGGGGGGTLEGGSSEGGKGGEGAATAEELTEEMLVDGSSPAKTGKQHNNNNNNNNNNHTTQGSASASASDKKYKSAKPHQGCGRQPEPVSKLRRQLRMGATSLIIACRQHPLPILIECLSLLTPSSPFVVYFEYMEPLVECYLYVTEVCGVLLIYSLTIIAVCYDVIHTPSYVPYNIPSNIPSNTHTLLT